MTRTRFSVAIGLALAGAVPALRRDRHGRRRADGLVAEMAHARLWVSHDDVTV